MPLTTFADQKVMNALMQAAALGAPATWQAGLLSAPSWLGNQAYTAGQHVVITAFNSTSGSTGRMFKCTTSGTSGATIPAGMNAGTTLAGVTVTDNSVTWTEVTNLFEAQGSTAAVTSGANTNLLGLELTSAGSYARVAVTANNTNFAGATNAQPSATLNATAVNFTTPTGNWAQVVGFLLCDASAIGAVNCWWWGLNTTAITPGTGSSPSFAVSSVTLTLE